MPGAKSVFMPEDSGGRGGGGGRGAVVAGAAAWPLRRCRR